MKSDKAGVYWSKVSREFNQGAGQSLWRSYSDQANVQWLSDWMAGRTFPDILKTDLFDEAVSQGLYPFLKDYGRTIHGIDISDESVNAARSRFPQLRASRADVRSLEFEDCSFDLVVSNSTLDHFDSTNDIEMGLRELFRVLKNGGELQISLDNLQNPVVWIRNSLPDVFLKRSRLTPYFVGKTLTRKGLITVLEKVGFSVLDSRSVMHCPRILAVLVANLLEKRASPRMRERFFSMLNWFEWLSALPTRYFTGYFVAVRAIKQPTAE